MCDAGNERGGDRRASRSRFRSGSPVKVSALSRYSLCPHSDRSVRTAPHFQLPVGDEFPFWFFFFRHVLSFDGDPGRTRTCDTQLRKLVLYPSELRGQVAFPLSGFPPVGVGYASRDPWARQGSNLRPPISQIPQVRYSVYFCSLVGSNH